MVATEQRVEHQPQQRNKKDHFSPELASKLDKLVSFHFEHSQENLPERDTQFQEKAAELTANYTPATPPESLSYTAIGDFFRGTTVDEMSALFAYDADQKEVLNHILQEQISTPYEAVFRDTNEPADYRRAREYNIGYVAGIIERMLGHYNIEWWENKRKSHRTPEEVDRLTTQAVDALREERDFIRKAVDYALALPDSKAEKKKVLMTLLTSRYPLEEGHPLEDSDPEKRSPLQNVSHLLDESDYLLDDLSESDEVMIDTNTAGDLATEATIAFYQNLYRVSYEQAVKELSALLNAPDYLLQQWATQPDPNDQASLKLAQSVLFPVYAANKAWIFSKPYQGFMEQHAVWQSAGEGDSDIEAKQAAIKTFEEKKPKKGKGRYNKQGNKYFTSFDNMSSEKGWPAVLLDIDQIRTGLRLRLTQG